MVSPRKGKVGTLPTVNFVDRVHIIFFCFYLNHLREEKSRSVQVLRQQIRGGGWGVKACADNADTGGGPKSEKSCCCNTWTLPNSNDNSIPSYWMTIQKLKKWGSFWIQKFQKYCDFWIQKSWKWTKIFLDPDIVEMVRFLDPETTEILPFLDPEFAKMDQ